MAQALLAAPPSERPKESRPHRTKRVRIVQRTRAFPGVSSGCGPRATSSDLSSLSTTGGESSWQTADSQTDGRGAVLNSRPPRPTRYTARNAQSPVRIPDEGSRHLALSPPIEPFNTARLQVSPVHEFYFEESGNPSGKPVVFVHGGPGGGSDPRQRRFFHPENTES